MMKNPGITDQDIEVTELFERSFGHGVDLGKTTDVRADPQSATPEGFNFLDHRRDLFFISPVDYHVCPFTSEQQGCRPANAGTGPGDQRGSAIETHTLSLLHFPTLQPGWSGASIAETVKEDKDKKSKRVKG